LEGNICPLAVQEDTLIRPPGESLGKKKPWSGRPTPREAGLRVGGHTGKEKKAKIGKSRESGKVFYVQKESLKKNTKRNGGGGELVVLQPDKFPRVQSSLPGGGFEISLSDRKQKHEPAKRQQDKTF